MNRTLGLNFLQYNRQFQPSVDQYGFPTMHHQSTPNQVQQAQQQQMQQQQQYRRHTVNNVLSTITPNQQQSLQQMYRESHPSPINSPSPRHSPLSKHPITQQQPGIYILLSFGIFKFFKLLSITKG